MSLHAYGVETPSVVRKPIPDRHNDDLTACPECGRPVGDPTTLKIVAPDVVDDVQVRTFITRAYNCDAHSYPLVLPVPVGQGAPSLGDDWTTVRIRYADTGVRHVAVPKTEVHDGE